jgi:hypothetical protein
MLYREICPVSIALPWVEGYSLVHEVEMVEQDTHPKPKAFTNLS